MAPDLTTGHDAESHDLDDLEADDAPRRRRNRVRWVALAIAVPLVSLIAVLATINPASTRAADSALLGKPAPALEGETIDGDTVGLRDFRGRWVLVNFFATWCVPCRQEHPELVRWQQRHAAAADATVLGVVFDDSIEAVRTFRQEEGGDWPMLANLDGRATVAFGVAGVPESYLVNPNGIIVSKIVGGVLEGELEALLQRAIAASG